MTASKTLYKHIVTTPDIAGGKPHVQGHRISVQNIVVWHEQQGYSVEEIASLFDLTLAEVYSALAYYFDHKQEIDRSLKESESFVDEMRQDTPSILAQRLYNRAD